ncbi:MAG: efflux RND transporter permease subunit [Terrimicrobiaceae bacterium]
MKFTDLFIRRPVLALVINLLILLGGLVAIQILTVRQYPRSDVAVITVTTAYIGANADLVRGYITTPLERVIASADGIDYIDSSSFQGLSTIKIHLKLNFDANAALTQVQAKVAQVRNDLPPEAEAPIIELETADNEFAAMYIGFYSSELDQNQITDYLTRVVQPKLSAINGVQRAEILGDRTFAMRIWLKPDRMAALNISPSDVRQSLQANNYLSAVGSTKGSMIAVNLIANTNLRTAEEFRKLAIKQANGTIVRLEEIADVVLGAENYNEEVRFNGQNATFMGIWVLPTANSLDVVRAIRNAFPAIEAAMPSGIKIGIPYDSTTYINDAIHEVIKTLVETLIIVMLVIYLFMGSWRAVLIPITAIPISLIGAVLLMFLFGFTINLLTLLAIVLSVGLVVDDAIVVVENVERHMQEGKGPLAAAMLGARELIGPIIAMTITLAAVYTPIGIQGGLTGALFREFAFTLAGAVLVSGVVALTLSPMMSSRLLRPGDDEKGFAGWINRRFDWLRAKYSAALSVTLRNRWIVLFIAGSVIFLILPFSMFSMKELAPKEDQGVVFGIVQAPPNATLDQASLFAGKLNDIFQSQPECDSTFQIINPTFGFSGLVTKPWSERKRTTAEIANALFPVTAQVPGVRIIPTTPPALPGGSNFEVEFVIASTAEPRELVELAQKLVAKAFASGMFMYADTDLKFDQPQAEIIFDRDKVASQGLDLRRIGADLSTLLGGDYVNRFSIQGRSYKVIPQVKRNERLTTDQLKNLYVRATDGKLVKLSTFATIKSTTEPRDIRRFQQLNSATIQGAIPPGVSLDAALKVLETEAAKILPAGFSIDYAGQSRQLRKEGNKLVITLILSLILIFLVLAAQFESFRDPLIILLGSVPLALSGALLFTFLGFTTINIYSQVGLVTLVGLIAKNGILIVEFANVLQRTGLGKFEAVTQAAVTRLRPILMTTAATVMGHFPLVIASGPGAGARNSIGVVLVSGMIIGTIFTLFVVPAIYTVVAKKWEAKNEEFGALPSVG